MRKNQLDDQSESVYRASTYNSIPEFSIEPQFAYREVREIFSRTRNPKANLGTFTTHTMDEFADLIMLEGMKFNSINYNEYPEIKKVQDDVLKMLGELFHLDKSHQKIIGTSTVGSSEACFLAGLAMKKNWQRQTLNSQAKPNIIFGNNAHVVWNKFCCYFDVEPRIIPLNLPNYILSGDVIREYIDENTIGICLTLGNTLTGEFDDIASINAVLEEFERQQYRFIPIHVDAASGGFVVPFLYPEMVWDFRLSHVVSINTSGHKYGFVYPGIGWIIWRNEQYLPDELIFKVDYLKGGIDSYSLNFTRPAGNILAQYYNFISLGKAGYRDICLNLQKLATIIKLELQKLSIFTIINQKESIPGVVFSIQAEDAFSATQFSEQLEKMGWQIPTSILDIKNSKIEILRIVLRRGFTLIDAEQLMKDVVYSINKLTNVTLHQKELL
jgi:glutamate decarboxylase